MKSNEGGNLRSGRKNEKTVGSRMVEKYRPRMSRLTDAERHKLMERGLQIIYGKTAEPRPAAQR